MLWLIALLVIALVAYREKVLRNARSFIWSLNIPGPLALPIIGNGYRFICRREDLFKRVRGIFTDYPQPIVRVWLGLKLFAVIQHPPYLQKILLSQMTEKDPIMDVGKPFLGEGLITGSGPKTKERRKIILPSFSAKYVQEYLEVFHREADILITKLAEALGKNSEKMITLEDFMHPCSIDIVCDTIIDYRLNAQNSLNQDFVEALEMMYFLMYDRIVKPWLTSDFLFSLTSMGRTQKKTLTILRSFVFNAIQQRRDHRQAILVEKVINSKLSKSERLKNYDEEAEELKKSQPTMKMSTSLDLLLDAADAQDPAISDTELIDEILSLFMASSDTIATISSFCLKMLAMHPEYQRKAIEELNRVTATHGDNLDSSALGELVFLECCIKDTIRLFPIAPFIVRINRTEFKLDDKVTIPSGVSVMMSLFMVHRNPKHWSHPEEFYPDHFQPEEAEKRHQYAYVPFSYGPRSCIGKLYAMTAIKILVSKVLRNFRVGGVPGDTSVKNMNLTSDISIRMIGGNKVTLKRIA